MTRRNKIVPHYWGFWMLLCLSHVALTLSRILANNKEGDTSQAIVVELAIVCDKEFGDLFQQNRQRILEYWTVFLADLSLRFRSLPSSNVSFRVTSVTSISSIDDQPFIENARNGNGTVKMTSVIAEFAKWTYRKRDGLPKFDVAMAVTAASLEGPAVGVAYGKGACLVDHRTDRGKYLSVVVIGDWGRWHVGAAAHELGHLLGAPHDVDVPDCNQTGLIMSGMSPKTQYFFSACSDKLIHKFLQSSQAACLKQTDYHENRPVLPVISQDKMPSMEGQCQKLLNNTQAFVYSGTNCQQIKCAQWHKQGFGTLHNHYPVDGTRCKYENEAGRCVRGTCLPNGFLLKNTATGLCLQHADKFASEDIPVMRPCPASYPLLTVDQFFLLSSGDKSDDGKLIATPYSVCNSTGVESGVKCLQVSEGENEDSAIINFVRCERNSNLTTLKWVLKGDNHGNLFLSHIFTGRCLGYNNESSQIFVQKDCTGDEFIWKLEQISEIGGDSFNNVKDFVDNKTSQDERTTDYQNYFFIVVCIAVIITLVVMLLLWLCSIYYNRARLNSFIENRKIDKNVQSCELVELNSCKNGER